MPVVLLVLGFVFGSIALSLLAYGGMRALAVRHADHETQDLATNLAAGIGAVHGLILAFVFSHEIGEYQRLRDALVVEAVAIGDIYYDIGRYGASNEHVVRAALVDYVRHVAQVEWSDQAWALRETVYAIVLDLEPLNPRQDALRSHMLSRLQELAELRWQRESAAHNQVGLAFWIAMYGGLVLLSVSLFTFRPRPLNLVLMSLHAGFMGLLMFFIFAFSNPFAEPGRVEPKEFSDIFEGTFGHELRPGRE